MDQPSQHPSTIITLNQPNSNDKGLPSTKAATRRSADYDSNQRKILLTTTISPHQHTNESGLVSGKRKNRTTHIQEAKLNEQREMRAHFARLAATSLQTPSPSDAHIPEPEQMGLQSAQTPRRHAMQENEEDEDSLPSRPKRKQKSVISLRTPPVIMPLTASNIATTTEKATASSAKTNLIPMTPRKNINPQPPPTACTVPKVTADNRGGSVSITDGQGDPQSRHADSQ